MNTQQNERLAAGPRQPGESVLEVEGIAKAFGTTQAIVDATLTVRAGEVHCIVGENGSGKSTLVKIVTGIHQPDSGVLRVDGREMSHLRGPKAALRAGIAPVLQETLVVEPLSVLDNIWLGADGLFRHSGDTADRRERSAEILAALLDDPPGLDVPVGSLSLSVRQACCIARAVVRDPKLLILDEATSALDVVTRDRLFDLLRRRAAAGGSVVFISHRMDEISEIGDRCTVMRSGETVATLDRGQATAGELVQLMTGGQHLVQREARVAVARDSGDVVMRAKGVTLAPGARPFDFELRAGELVGLAGLEGHGQDDFLKVLCARGPEGAEVLRTGPDGQVAITSPEVAAAQGVVYVPRERRAESLLESKSIRENFGLPTLDRDVRGGLLSHKRTRARLAEYVQRLSIKIGDPEHLITTLSGGNQQKVVMARWLAADPRVLLLNDPTRGVDVGAKRELYDLLGELVQQDIAIVMLSTEVDEHVELMDRVLVFREHELSSELHRDELSREQLIASFFAQERSVVR